jgi:2-keto-3-deoxy-L-rhamnonate aldolase RhmA
VDVIMVGPLDLSATVGAMGDTRAPRVLEIMEDVPKKLAGTGVACATTLAPYEHHELAVKWGYGVLNVGNPLA